MKLPAAVFNYFIQNTAFAITNEVSRFTLSGAKFIVADGSAKMITTDGHRLAYIEKKLTSSIETDAMETLIPKKALLELAKVSRETSSDISFGEDTNHLYFEMEGRLLISRKLSGKFPNYEMVMPKDNDKIAIFDLDEMRPPSAASLSWQTNATARSASPSAKARSNSPPNPRRRRRHRSRTGRILRRRIPTRFQLAVPARIPKQRRLAPRLKRRRHHRAPKRGEPPSPTADGTAAQPPRHGHRPSPLRIAFEFKDANAQTQMSIPGDSTYDYKYIVMPLRI